MEIKAGNLDEMNAEVERLDDKLAEITESTLRFERIFASTISRAVVQGSSFEDTLRSIGQRISELALKNSVAPLENLLGSVFNSAISSGLNRFSAAGQAPLSNNGSPSGTPATSNPLASASNVIFNITTNDASSFKKSETQISSLLARTVTRGQRGL